MAEHRHIFPIVKMSEVFDVSRSGYYSWMSREPSDRAKENQRLLRRIKQDLAEVGEDLWQSSHSPATASRGRDS
ncbi:MAG: hypothetical protein U5K69_30210 [Balneolaceae bacterium]|nr:hypothetical protein [Balneolaceae bacterium]